MTKKLGLQAFLRREVIKSKRQVPTETESPNLTTKTLSPVSDLENSEEPERNIFRDIFGDEEEDYKAPLEKLRNSKTPFAIRYETKQKTEIRIQIEELRKQLLAVIDTSFKTPRERTFIARERDRLLRSIERLEAREQKEKDNALRGMYVFA